MTGQTLSDGVTRGRGPLPGVGAVGQIVLGAAGGALAGACLAGFVFASVVMGIFGGLGGAVAGLIAGAQATEGEPGA